MIEELERVFFHAYRPQQGDTVVEVGAGAGGETHDLARMVGPAGLVVAVEAHPAAYATLAHNPADNVTCVHAAVVDHRGGVLISDDGSLLRNRVVGGNHPGALNVDATTLDDLCADLTEVDLLKMNIEGSETAALRGGPQTLAKTSHIVVSCHDFLGIPTRDDVRRILEAAGFHVSSRDDAEDSCRADYLYGTR